MYDWFPSGPWARIHGDTFRNFCRTIWPGIAVALLVAVAVDFHAEVTQVAA